MNVGDVIEYTCEFRYWNVWAVYCWRKTPNGRGGSKVSEHRHKWEAEYEANKLNKQLKK